MFRLPENQCSILSAIAALKKEKTEMSLKSSIGPSHSISEKATSHVCRLKRLETRVVKNHVFSNQASEGTVSYMLGVKWLSGCSEVGDNNEIYHIYIYRNIYIYIYIY